jgi:uncharacterized repeat protein (TIGR01451 family)
MTKQTPDANFSNPNLLDRGWIQNLRQSILLLDRLRLFSLTGVSPKNLVLASIFAPVLLGSALFTSSARALDLPLTGNSTGTTGGLLSGIACTTGAKYRYTTSAVLGTQALDLLVEVLDQDNENSICITRSGALLSVRMESNNVTPSAFMDLRITVVKAGTIIPVAVDRIAVTGFDLDSSPSQGAGSDDLYFTSPSGTYISSSSVVTVSSNTSASFNTKLTGRTDNDCSDIPPVVEITCRGGVIFTTGTGGVNQVSTFDVRLKNDNAYGSTPGSRLSLLSLQVGDLIPILNDITDRGDAPTSYGDAGHKISANVMFGNGTPPDHDSAAQASANADSDDKIDAANNKFNDEQAVKLASGASLSGQSLPLGSTTNVKVTTFGAGYLSAWIDLNHDGDFSDPGENIIVDKQITTTGTATNTIALPIPNTSFFGKSFIRFRYTTGTGIGSSGISTAEGEVQDYSFTFTGPAKLLLVKRITAINGVDITTYTDNTGSLPEAANDNNKYWPLPLNTNSALGATNISSFLRGAVDAGNVKPGDEIEYTIYFLNAGGNNTSSVRICDPIKGKQAYVNNSMKMLLGGSSTEIALSDNSDGLDRANKYVTGAAPTGCNESSSTATGANNGGVTVQLIGSGASNQTDLTVMPGTTGPKTTGATDANKPDDSYGWFRFKTKVP